MFLFKNYFLFVFSLALSFSLQAENPDPIKGQAPPFSINIGDTCELTLPELKNQVLPVSSVEAVEDTVLPPCDIIFYKSGKLDYCKIIETTPTTITYKMCDYQDGPNIVVNKSDIHKVRYANGKEELIAAEKQQTVNAYVKPRKDILATLSFYFGLGSVATILLFGVIIPVLALAGLVLGIISILKIRRRKGELRGMGLAIVGVILCALVLLLLLAL